MRYNTTDAQKPGEAPVSYLDDLHVRQRFTSGSHLLDEAQIKRFASEFDPQPFHFDDEAARTTQFGGLVNSPWCITLEWGDGRALRVDLEQYH